MIEMAGIFENSTGFTLDLGDTIGGTFMTAEWQAIIDYLNGDNLDQALAAAAAAQPYVGFQVFLPSIIR